jgi:hypothetical protein
MFYKLTSIIIFSLFIFVIIPFNSICQNKTDSELFNRIKKETFLKDNERLIVLFQSLGVCSACYATPNSIIDCAIEKMNDTSEKIIKIICIVDCSRDSELLIFKKRYNWKYHLLACKNDPRTKLKVEGDIDLIVFDPKGNIRFKHKASDMDLKDNCKRIVESLKR